MQYSEKRENQKYSYGDYDSQEKQEHWANWVALCITLTICARCWFCLVSKHSKLTRNGSNMRVAKLFSTTFLWAEFVKQAAVSSYIFALLKCTKFFFRINFCYFHIRFLLFWRSTYVSFSFEFFLICSWPLLIRFHSKRCSRFTLFFYITLLLHFLRYILGQRFLVRQLGVWIMLFIFGGNLMFKCLRLSFRISHFYIQYLIIK